MSEIINPVPAANVQSRRCLACRLPPDLQEEIERDRIRGWATFAQLVEKLSSKGFTLSDSAVRRHFRHVERDRYFDGARARMAVVKPYRHRSTACWKGRSARRPSARHSFGCSLS